MSRPWDGLPTPLIDAAILRLDCDDSCCGIYTYNEDKTEYDGYVCRADKARDLERQLCWHKARLADARGLLDRARLNLNPHDKLIDDIRAHLASAKEEA